jgi:hypothetical protein
MTRTGERERFVRDFFKHHGCAPDGNGRGPCRIPLTRGLKQRLRIRELTAVFHAEDLDEHPDGQLMVPGNPVFDRLIATARRFGGLSRRYRRANRQLLDDDAARAVLGDVGEHLEVFIGAPRYRSSFLFTFRVAYRSIESFDAIHPVMLSGLSGRYQEGDGFFRGQNLAETPESDIAEEGSAEVGEILVGALDELESRIGADVDRFVSRSEAQLEQESQRLNQFFIDLIEEEKTRLLRRKQQAPSVGAEERKVEWVQRLDRENRLFAPRVAVHLIGLEELRVPARAVEVRRGREPLVEAELDLASGELVGAPCASCGADMVLLHVCTGEHLVCRECLEECALCGG